MELCTVFRFAAPRDLLMLLLHTSGVKQEPRWSTRLTTPARGESMQGAPRLCDLEKGYTSNHSRKYDVFPFNTPIHGLSGIARFPWSEVIAQWATARSDQISSRLRNRQSRERDGWRDVTEHDASEHWPIDFSWRFKRYSVEENANGARTRR